MSCPCKHIDEMRQCEYCTASDAKVGGVLMCDLDFNYCPDYLKTIQETPQRLSGVVKKVRAQC